MLKYALGLLGLSLGFDLGRILFLAFGPSGGSYVPYAILLSIVWPVLSFAGLAVGANIGSWLDRLRFAELLRQPSAARSRGWLIRCLGLVQCGLSMALLLALAWLSPLPPVPSQLAPLAVARSALPGTVWTALVLIAAAVWFLSLKGWFELLTGVRFREWSSFWGGLSSGRRVLWAGGYYASCVVLFLLLALMLIWQVTQ